MKLLAYLLAAIVSGAPAGWAANPGLVRRSPSEGIPKLRIYNGLVRREMDPAMVQELTATLTEGIGEQLNQVLGKAKELDGKGSPEEQQRKIAELEGSINEIALRMADQVIAQAGSRNSEAVDSSRKDGSSQSSSASSNESTAPTQADVSLAAASESGDNSSSQSSSAAPAEKSFDGSSFKDELKAEMKKMKDEMKGLKRRAAAAIAISREGAAVISQQVGDAVASRLPQDQQADAPLVKAVATTIAEQVMKNVASSMP